MVSVEQNKLQQIVAERMLELIDVRSPWNRSLWQLGTVHAILEVLECTEATWGGGIPNDKAMKYLVGRCQQQVEGDVGVGSSAVRQLLAQRMGALAPKKSAPQQVLAAEIEELARRAKRDYLKRWKEWVEQGLLSQALVERTARLLVAHFLDDGFHVTHIHGWLKSLIANTSDSLLLAVLDQGHAMCREGEERYDFIVPAGRGARDHHKQMLSEFLFEGDPASLISEYELSTEGTGGRNVFIFKRLVSQESALIIEQSFSARDPHSAAAKLGEWLQKVEARAEIGGSSTLSFSPFVLDRTTRKLRNLRSSWLDPRVPSLERHGLFAREMDSQLDNGLALLASSRRLPQMASVATIWAAVEGLLGHPGAQGVEAADGLAAIVACGFPRAELEDLGRRPLTEEARAANVLSNLDQVDGAERAQMILDAIRTSGAAIFTSATDVAAAERILQIDKDPEGTIKRVELYFSDVFRRLYYQRNFVMHAAKFDSISLPSAVRSAPKLVAAGLDRVVHARHVRRPVTPLALSARASNEIAMLGKDGAQDFYRLLK